MFSGPRRILLVFEFPPSDAEWQTRDLAARLCERQPELLVSFCSGFVREYTPGGLRPMRVLNAGWVHFRAFTQTLLGPYDAILVRSAPPLIQLTVALACAIRRIPYWIWLMDAHPEIEFQLWANRPVLGYALAWLERWNQRCLARSALVIVLDPRMRERLVSDLPDSRVIVCPTWGSTPLAIASAAADR